MIAFICWHRLSLLRNTEFIKSFHKSMSNIVCELIGVLVREGFSEFVENAQKILSSNGNELISVLIKEGFIRELPLRGRLYFFQGDLFA